MGAESFDGARIDQRRQNTVAQRGSDERRPEHGTHHRCFYRHLRRLEPSIRSGIGT